jgi:alpha-L-fucosidase
MGTGFSYRYDDTYKSTRTLIHLLLDIIAKGGNLALNISPAPDGRIPAPALDRIKGMGTWLKINGEGVYGTRAAAPYKNDNFVFTKKGDIFYAFAMYSEGEAKLPERFTILAEIITAGSVIHIGSGQHLAFTLNGNILTVEFPSGITRNEYADLFIIEK